MSRAAKGKKKKGGAATWGRGLYLEPGEDMELDHCDRSIYERCPSCLDISSCEVGKI